MRLSPDHHLLVAPKAQRRSVAKIFRRAAVWLSKANVYDNQAGACWAIHKAFGKLRYSWLKELACDYFAHMFSPKYDSCYFWSFSNRYYPQREARILALLLAAESLEHP